MVFVAQEIKVLNKVKGVLLPLIIAYQYSKSPGNCLYLMK